MLLTLLLGGVAGWGAGFGEDHVRKLLAQAFDIDAAAIRPVELRSITLVVALFLAALVAWVIASPSAVALMFGALIGVLVPRLKEVIRTARTPDYDA